MNISSLMADSITPSTQRANSTSEGDSAEKSFKSIFCKCVAETDNGAKSSSQSDCVKEQAENLISELETLETIMTDLKGLFSDFFTSNDIPKNPPVEFGYDKSSDELVVKSSREDADRISELINSDPELKEGIKDALSKAGAIVSLTEMFNRGGAEAMMDSIPEVSVSILYGTSTSVTADRAVALDEDAEGGEASEEVEEMFAKIRHMLLLLFINVDPESEEEQEENAAESSEETQPSSEPEDGSQAYKQLLMEIEQTRQRALFMFGNDKNKYALAIESYKEAQSREEAQKGESGKASDAKTDKTQKIATGEMA